MGGGQGDVTDGRENTFHYRWCYTVRCNRGGSPGQQLSLNPEAAVGVEEFSFLYHIRFYFILLFVLVVNATLVRGTWDQFCLYKWFLREAQGFLIPLCLIWNGDPAFKFHNGLTPQSGSAWHNALVKGEERGGILEMLYKANILKKQVQYRTVFLFLAVKYVHRYVSNRV